MGELLPVSVALKTSHTALKADCPGRGNSGTKQEVPFTKLILESHPLYIPEDERHPEAEEGAVLEGERHGDGQDVHLDPPLPVLRRELRHSALDGDEIRHQIEWLKGRSIK